MSELYRAQVLLERKQHERLRKLAAVEGRSMSDLIREAVAEYLVDQEQESQHRNWQEAMARLTEIREGIRARHGTLPDDFLLNDRAERADEIWERMVNGADES